MSRGFSEGKQWIKFANTNLFILSTQDDDLTVKIYNSSFDKFYVNITSWKDDLHSLQLANKVRINTFTNNLPLASSR